MLHAKRYIRSTLELNPEWHAENIIWEVFPNYIKANNCIFTNAQESTKEIYNALSTLKEFECPVMDNQIQIKYVLA